MNQLCFSFNDNKLEFPLSKSLLNDIYEFRVSNSDSDARGYTNPNPNPNSNPNPNPNPATKP